jgi:uncharacterized protein with von Willebrand factor type A (vWA) domain
MPIDLRKIETKAPELLSLAKNAREAIDKSALNGQLSNVALVLDFSGSMANLYRNGSVQRLAEKVLALGTQLDEDGAIDIFVFDSSAAHLGAVSIDDFRNSVDRLTRGRHMGSTDYAAAFRAVEKRYTPKKGLFSRGEATASHPTLALFITDGVPNRKPEAEKVLTEISSKVIFWQFISIGREEIPFLQKLDDLTDRYIDNADYEHIVDVDKLSDVQLFNIVLKEYPEWVTEMKKRGKIT